MGLRAIRGQHHLVQETLEIANPVASSSNVEPSQRAQRDGSVSIHRLKVRAKPVGNHALENRPDRPKLQGTTGSKPSLDSIELQSWNCCDALRCSGPHARYTDRANEFITLAGRSG